MRRNCKQPSLLVQLADLFLIELTNWRWTWRGMVVVGMIFPLSGMVFLGFFARSMGPDVLAYVMTGNVVLALMFENLDKVTSRFAYMRAMGNLEYYATLPIQKYVLVLAVVLSFLLLSLPSLVVTVVGGSLLLGLPIVLHPVVLIVVPLCAVSLAGIGALIGSMARNPQEAGSLSLLVTLVLLGLGPVLVPPARLPGAMVIVGRFSPATYAASALRQALLGPLTGQIGLDLAALAGFTAVVLWLVGRKMDWRQG